MTVARGALALRGVGKSYARDGAASSSVIEACSFDVPAASFTAIVGPSGCGKTTLVRLIAGYEAPDAGSIAIDGRPVRAPGIDRLVVFQETRLFPWMTILDNVAFGLQCRGRRSRTEIRAAAEALLVTVGLDGFGDRYPSQLSGGMQRRAELARALINAPDAMLLDEPFRGLDAMTRALMQTHVAAQFERDPRTHVFVTSEIDEAVFLADRLVLMTNRPMRVRAVIEVDLPRPRRRDVELTPRFREILAEALEVTHDEGARAFATSRR